MNALNLNTRTEFGIQWKLDEQQQHCKRNCIINLFVRYISFFDNHYGWRFGKLFAWCMPLVMMMMMDYNILK